MYCFFVLQGILQQKLYDRQDGEQPFVFTATLLLATTSVSVSVSGVSIALQKCNLVRRVLLDLKSRCAHLGLLVGISQQMKMKSVTDDDYQGQEMVPTDQDCNLLPLPIVAQSTRLFLYLPLSRVCLNDVLICSASFVVSKCMGWHSLTLVDYPTQALGKCAKPVAILLLSLVLKSGRKYSVNEFITVFWIAASLFVFNIGKVHSSNDAARNTIIGNVLLLLSLMCDGVIGGRQDRLATHNKLSNLEMMFCINLAASILVLPIFLYLELPMFVSFLVGHKRHIVLIVMFSCCCAFGQIFMYSAIKRIGALHTSIITTTRKFLMVILSVVLFGKSLESLQWVALGSVFMAITFRTVQSQISRLTTYE